MQWRRLIGFGSGCVMFFLLGALFGGDARADGVHRCSGAGKWFPDDPRELRTTIEKYLDAAEAPEIQGQLRAIVVPHAGYQYSGATAAHAYKLLQGREIRRVIILAFSHSTRISGASVLDVDAYETPLGSVAVDREAVAALLENEDFKTVQAAHRTEHSDENQLPFLQCVLGEDFKIVSILVGPGPMTEKEDLERLHRIAEAIRPLMDDRTLLVASSDFTHYGSNYRYAPFRRDLYENIRALDGEAIHHLIHAANADSKTTATQNALLAINSLLGSDRQSRFVYYHWRTGASICGQTPLTLLMELVSETPGYFLHYDRSNMDGDYSFSVGYAALAYADPPVANVKIPDWVRPAADRAELNADERATLLKMARNAIAAQLEGSPHRYNLEQYHLTPRLMASQGAFVTLSNPDGSLRGCIGNVSAIKPLYWTVLQMAQEAAFGDPRFPALKKKELDKLHIEISALLTPDGTVCTVPTRPIDNIDQIRVGRDGLTIEHKGRHGLLLPQVPTEQGWSRNEFLKHLCAKAGLPAEAWREAVIERFTAQVFGEEEMYLLPEAEKPQPK